MGKSVIAYRPYELKSTFIMKWPVPDSTFKMCIFTSWSSNMPTYLGVPTFVALAISEALLEVPIFAN